MQDAACSMHPVAAPAQAFEYLLSVGRMMVIFDGLDELLDTRDRGDITRDIESFCAYFPTAPVLVTSREVGYDQTPLDQQLFTTLRSTRTPHADVPCTLDIRNSRAAGWCIGGSDCWQGRRVSHDAPV